MDISLSAEQRTTIFGDGARKEGSEVICSPSRGSCIRMQSPTRRILLFLGLLLKSIGDYLGCKLLGKVENMK